MRARRDLPVVHRDTARFARRCGIGESDHGMIPDPALKNVSEYDHRMVLRIERKPEPAAFAGVVDRHPRFRIGRAAVLEEAKNNPAPSYFLPASLAGTRLRLSSHAA